jgi:type I restriction enzyme S subunit
VHAKTESRDPGLPRPFADLFPGHFVDSELGEIPAGWGVAELSEVVDIIDCLHSKKPERKEHGKPLLQLWNIRQDGLLDISDTYYIDETDYRLWVSRMEASSGDCVITNVGRVGAVAQVPESVKAALGRNMTGIRYKMSFRFPTFLIECLLSDAMRNEIVLKMDTGTILEALNVRNIPKLRFVRSGPEVLRRFEQLTRPLRARMEKNLAESHTLAALRDTLLPKLISGELRVKDAERVVTNTPV